MKTLNKLFANKSLIYIFLVVFAIMTVFSIILASTIFTNIVRFDIENRTSQTNQANAINTKKYLEQTLNSQLNLTIGIESAYHTFDDVTDEELNTFFDDMFTSSEYLHSVELLDTNGVITYTYPTDDLRIGISKMAIINESNLDSPETYSWTEPYRSPLRDDLFISLVYKSEDFYIIANFNIEIFEALDEELKAANLDKELMILDPYGITIYDSSSDNDLLKTRFDNFDVLKEDYEAGKNITIEINQIDSIANVEQIEELDWYVIVYESTLSANQFSQRIISMIIFLTIAIVVVYFLSLVHSVMIIRMNLKKLHESLSFVTEGNYGFEIEEIDYKEFKDISVEFNKLSSSLKHQTDRLRNLAYYDYLTGLYSRNFLKDYFDEEILDSSKKAYFIYIDLSRFKLINESFGYSIGDEVIILIGQRLKMLFEQHGAVARIGSDEFLVISIDQNDFHIDDVLKELNDLFSETFKLNKLDISVSSNFGISIYPEHGKYFDDVLSSSIIALEKAKKDSESSFNVYKNEYLDEFSRRVSLEISIDKAFKEKEFFIVLQPILDIETEKIRGFEALSRWRHPELDIVYPGEYIHLLEANKKIHLLDKYVLNESLKFARHIKQNHGIEYITSVNISAETILRNDFVNYVKETLELYEVNPNNLELEITESVFIRDFEFIKDTVYELRSLGVKFSEDDFGDGYSALTYMTQIDLNTLKISKSFLIDIESNFNKRIMINTIINLAKDLGLETIIEGVETENVLNVFRDLDCDYVQGYYYYRPLDLMKAEKLIKDKNNKKGK